uniref:AMP-binding enzyme C-terminal domain-containing protein n=1 Tax=Panagrolaimus superbus TaxID=310955 RepID=A0A914Z3K2_9BILA
MKELIKVSGLQVAPAELEALLLTHSKIKDAAVIGIPHEQKGEVPRAYVVVASSNNGEEEVTEDEIKAFVASKAAPYKQLKGGVEFVKEIPKSASGKILRRLLRDQFKKSQKVAA